MLDFPPPFLPSNLSKALDGTIFRREKEREKGRGHKTRLITGGRKERRKWGHENRAVIWPTLLQPGKAGLLSPCSLKKQKKESFHSQITLDNAFVESKNDNDWDQQQQQQEHREVFDRTTSPQIKIVNFQ